jgi:hypothetical protein
MNQDLDHEGINRRQFLGRVGATTLGAGAAYYGGSQYAGSPVQNGQAIAPLVIGAGVAGSVAIGWALREYQVLGSDSVPEGLTADALKLNVYDVVRARKSNNESTFIDNRNILDGAKNAAYADGKIAAIEALNAQKTQQEVQDAAIKAVDSYVTTIKKNLLKSWNESVMELSNLFTSVKDHPELSLGDVMRGSNYITSLTPEDRAHTLPDGSEFMVKFMVITWTGVNPYSNWSPVEFETNCCARADANIGFAINGNDINHLPADPWMSLFEDITTKMDDVRNGLITWVDGVYGDVQAGTIDTGELLTPREQARIASEEEGTPQALADLQALNIPTDLDREAEVYLPDIDATIYGQLSYTGDITLKVGTVDPNATDADGNAIYPGTFYFTYDISRGEGTWSEYNTGIDGGQLTFTSEPYAQTVYRVQTAAGETAEAKASDFTDNGDGTWTVDLTDQLENAITDAEEITFYSETGETQYETIQLTETFEIRGFTDSEGNSYTESNFEQSEPQTDTNYISQEEWQAQQDRYDELIQKYQESQNDGGGTIFDRLGGGAIPREGLIVGGAALLIALFR